MNEREEGGGRKWEFELVFFKIIIIDLSVIPYTKFNMDLKQKKLKI